MNQNSALDVITKRREQFTFITPDDVKISTGLAANITNDVLIVPIITATNLRIKPILGVTLFNNLKNEAPDWAQILPALKAVFPSRC